MQLIHSMLRTSTTKVNRRYTLTDMTITITSLYNAQIHILVHLLNKTLLFKIHLNQLKYLTVNKNLPIKFVNVLNPVSHHCKFDLGRHESIDKNVSYTKRIDYGFITLNTYTYRYKVMFNMGILFVSLQKESRRCILNIKNIGKGAKGRNEYSNY